MSILTKLKNMVTNLKNKKFIMKSAKTAVLFVTKYETLLSNLDSDLNALSVHNEKTEVNEKTEDTNSNIRFRSKRNQKVKPASEIQEVTTDIAALKKVYSKLNVYHIDYQAKAIRYFYSKAKDNKYSKYLLKDDSLESKLDKIDIKCDNVVSLAKELAVDKSLKILLNNGILDNKEKLKSYKEIIAKYI